MNISNKIITSNQVFIQHQSKTKEVEVKKNKKIQGSSCITPKFKIKISRSEHFFVFIFFQTSHNILLFYYYDYLQLLRIIKPTFPNFQRILWPKQRKIPKRVDFQIEHLTFFNLIKHFNC